MVGAEASLSNMKQPEVIHLVGDKGNVEQSFLSKETTL